MDLKYKISSIHAIYFTFNNKFHKISFPLHSNVIHFLPSVFLPHTQTVVHCSFTMLTTGAPYEWRKWLHHIRVLFENSFSVVRELFFCVDLFVWTVLFVLNEIHFCIQCVPAFETIIRPKRTLTFLTKDITFDHFR